MNEPEFAAYDPLAEGPGTPWSFELCREDLLKTEQLSRAAGVVWPQWTDRLKTCSGEHSIVLAAERIADEIVRESNCVSAVPPPVRVSRIAKHLQAQLRFTEPDNSAVRGRLIRRGDGWMIVAPGKPINLARQIVAHELAHALLYRSNESIDVNSWRSSRWSSLEESICNYLARLLLAPASLLSSMLDDVPNLGERLVRLAGALTVPIKFSALRMLDGIGAPGGVTAVLLWRQYHPFDKRLLRKDSFQAPKPERTHDLVRVLTRIGPQLPFSTAVKLWQDQFVASPRAEPPTTPHPGLFSAVRMIAANLKPEYLSHLTEPWGSHYFYPEWVVWRGRPDKAFVPVRRGSARRGSVIAELAADERTTGEIRCEEVRIGDLRGTFRVHGFAHGRASSGGRIIVQVLEALEG